MQERDIFDAAVAIANDAERAAYLDQACAGDSELREHLEGLLELRGELGDFLEAPACRLDTTIDEATIAERPGAVIGPYKLLEQIGEGGFGVVFMAEQMQPVRRKVALKVLKPGMDTRQVIARFEAERQALALMDHPNIAKVLDAGQTSSGRPYFVMDLVKGLPITDYCDQNQLTTKERLKLFVSVCQAVQHAHQKGIIHRDIKPSNVQVTLHDGTALVKVIDFGVAKALGQQLTDKTLYTGFAQLIGTPLYMSPEQAALSNVDVDTRSDIYSLGVLLYELLTGTTPFGKERLKEADYDQLRRIICDEEPPRPSTRISTLGQTAATVSTNRKSDPKRLSQLFRAELDWIVMKCLEKDRSRRYETTNGLARDIQRYLNDEPVTACPPSAGYRLAKFARRNKRSLAMAACIFLAVVGITGAMGWAVRDKQAREEGIERDRLAREDALDQAVETTLNETGPLADEGKWPEALAEVERADKLLAAAGRTERPSRLLELRKDLSMAQRLEEIYRMPSRNQTGNLIRASEERTEPSFQAQADRSEQDFFWGRAQDARFAKEFRVFGIDIEALAAQEAAARIGRTSIRPALVQALDEWAAMRRRARGDNDEFWKKLLEIAQQADTDGWRNQFREALLQQDRPALEKLVAVVPIRTVPPATAYLLGHALRELGNLDKAMAVLREAHRQHPDDFWLNDALGCFSKDFCRPPRYDDALRYYSMNVALRPNNARTHHAVAELLSAKGAFEEAIAVYSKAIELDPKDADARFGRGAAYHELHQDDKALVDHGKAIELDANHAVAWYWRGLAYKGLHEYDKAIVDYSKAIELGLNNAWLWYWRGRAYYELRQYDEAIADYTKAIELDAKNAEFLHRRGHSYAELRQYDKALADFSKSIELNPGWADPWYYRAMLHLQLGDPGGHRGECTAMLKRFRSSRNPDAVYRTVWTCVVAPDSVSDWAPLLQLAEKFGAANSKDFDKGMTFGALLYRAGRFEEATRRLTEAEATFKEAKNPLGALAYNQLFLAMAHARLGHAEQAKEWLAKAIHEIEQPPPERAKDPGANSWNQLLTLRLLRQEAEALIG